MKMDYLNLKILMDYLNLKILEEEVKQDREVCILRVFDKTLNRSRRVVFTNGKDFAELDEPLRGILRGIRSEMNISRKVADMRDIPQELSGYLIPVKAAVELLLPKVKLMVFGAGHVGQAVGLVGCLLGFDVTIIDDRPEFASRNRFPDPRVNLLVGNYSEVLEHLKLGINSAVVIVTRGHQFDEVCLRSAIRSNTGYLGMIGSKRRVLSIINRLEKDGYSRTEFEKLHAPIGLQIGAKSPQEIAVAIVAEIINSFNNRNSKC